MSITIDINAGASAASSTGMWDEFYNSAFFAHASYCVEGLAAYVVAGLALSILESSFFWGPLGEGIGTLFSRVTMIVYDENPDQAYMDFRELLRDFKKDYPYIFIISFIFDVVIGTVSAKAAVAIGCFSSYFWGFLYEEARTARAQEYHQRKSDESSTATAEVPLANPDATKVRFSELISIAAI